MVNGIHQSLIRSLFSQDVIRSTTTPPGYLIIDNRRRDWKRVYIRMMMSRRMLVTAHPLHTWVQFNTTMAFVAFHTLVYVSNQGRTKRKAIEEVNQTVKSVFEQYLLMYLSPVHA